jgi:hypothetical protein
MVRRADRCDPALPSSDGHRVAAHKLGLETATGVLTVIRTAP